MESSYLVERLSILTISSVYPVVESSTHLSAVKCRSKDSLIFFVEGKRLPNALNVNANGSEPK